MKVYSVKINLKDIKTKSFKLYKIINDENTAKLKIIIECIPVDNNFKSKYYDFINDNNIHITTGVTKDKQIEYGIVRSNIVFDEGYS